MPRFSSAVLCTVWLLSTLQNGDSFMMPPSNIHSRFGGQQEIQQQSSSVRQDVSLSAKKKRVYANPPVDGGGLVEALVSIVQAFSPSSTD